MARQMLSQFIINSAIQHCDSAPEIIILNIFHQNCLGRSFFSQKVPTKTFHPVLRLAQWWNNMVIHFHIKINVCPNLQGVGIAFWIIDHREKI